VKCLIQRLPELRHLDFDCGGLFVAPGMKICVSMGVEQHRTFKKIYDDEAFK